MKTPKAIFIKKAAIKKFCKEEYKIKVSAKALLKLDELLRSEIELAKNNANEEGHTTIMERDVSNYM